VPSGCRALSDRQRAGPRPLADGQIRWNAAGPKFPAEWSGAAPQLGCSAEPRFSGGAAPSRDIPRLLAYAARGEPSRAPLISAELPLAGVQQALDSLAAAVGGGT
jgi:hypothetical protein